MYVVNKAELPSNPVLSDFFSLDEMPEIPGVWNGISLSFIKPKRRTFANILNGIFVFVTCNTLFFLPNVV